MIFGIGTDIVEIGRLRAVLARHPETFAKRTFTPAERAGASEVATPEQYFAGRWAAKEALSKALGVGFGLHCSWQDLEILNNAAGQPIVTASGPAAEFLKKQGIMHLHVSISHEKTYAVAMAVAEKKG
jgi:holo-[acyl-carrier protein] synthase